MKLTSVELHPRNTSDVASLSFRDPARKNPYNVKAIVGLDADEIIPRYYGGSGESKFYSLSLEKRILVIRVALNPRPGLQESYSSLRDELYKLIASSRTGQLDIQFKNGTSVIAAISGFVTKLEAPHFNKEPEVQITVSCDEPMLKAPDRAYVNVDSLSPAHTYIKDRFSTSPHGFIFDLEFTANTASLTIEDPDDGTWTFMITPSGGFLDGDILHFSSEYNNKDLYLTRSATVIYLADRINPGSIWPIMFPGDNYFVLSNPGNVVWTLVGYYPTYWGV